MEHQQTDGTSTDWNITRQRSVLNNIYKHTTTPQLVPPPFLTLIIPLTTCLHSTQPNFTNSVVNPLSPSLSYIRRQWYNFTSGNGRVSRLILPNGVRWTYTERLKEVCFFLPCVSLFVELRYGKSGRGLWEPIATDWIRLALAAESVATLLLQWWLVGLVESSKSISKHVLDSCCCSPTRGLCVMDHRHSGWWAGLQQV